MTLFAIIQLNSSDNYQENLGKAIKYIGIAANQGAKVVALPETFTFIGEKDQIFPNTIDGDLCLSLGSLAKHYGIFLLAGSFQEKTTTENKFYNTSILFSPTGDLINIYRKIHLFSLKIEQGISLDESDSFLFGSLTAENLQVIKTPYGQMATTICYDLRFPELFRDLTKKGAEIIFVPSAFTMQTGKEHWEVLLRARAIENQVFIVAPNQCGEHFNDRASYGNSMIIDPWGKVLVRADDKEGIIYADLDLDYLKKVRRTIPCLENIRLS